MPVKDMIKIVPAQDGMFSLMVYSGTDVYKGCVVCEDISEVLEAVGDVYEEEYDNPGFKEN